MKILLLHCFFVFVCSFCIFFFFGEIVVYDVAVVRSIKSTGETQPSIRTSLVTHELIHIVEEKFSLAFYTHTTPKNQQIIFFACSTTQ